MKKVRSADPLETGRAETEEARSDVVYPGVSPLAASPMPPPADVRQVEGLGLPAKFRI